MVNPGAFKAARLNFLISEKPYYSEAVKNGHSADALAVIQRRFFKRFPVELDDNIDPTPEELAAVDDEVPDPEITAPSLEILGRERYNFEVENLARRQRKIESRKEQIKHWLAYQFSKDNDINPKESGAHNPYRALLNKLSGNVMKRPRCKTAMNMWWRSEPRLVADEVKRRASLDLTLKPNQMVAFRDKVARQMFNLLPLEDQEYWKKIAQDDHQKLMDEWKKEMEGEPSTDPVDRQRCIQGLVQFMQPILDIVCEATGWKATFIAGGPEPADDGRLNIISVHSGTTSGDIKMNFGRVERQNYKKYVVPLYGQFLRKCYTLEECRARALPTEHTLDPLEQLDLKADGANFDTWNPATEVSPSHTASPSTACQFVTPASNIGRTDPSPANLAPRSTAVTMPVSTADSVEVQGDSLPANVLVGYQLSREIPMPPEEELVDTPPLSPIPSPPASPIVPHRSPVASTPLSPIISPPSPIIAHLTPPSGSREVEDSACTPILLGKRGRSDSLDANKGRRKKKGKGRNKITSTNTSTSNIAENDENWFQQAIKMLQSESLGTDWSRLTDDWIRFEEQNAGDNDRGFLSAAHRPALVGAWIQRARKPTWRPHINNVKAYEKSFKTWWSTLLPQPGENWDRLRKPGVNGVLSVLAGLFLWGYHVHITQGDAQQQDVWNVMVRQCSDAFSSMNTA